MKIFISWSGEESKQIALLLKTWIKKMLQATDPWMSDVDIEPGTRWSERISAELERSDFGILCVTPSNRSSEWIHFEAGALSMALSNTERKVVPLLIGFDERGELHRSPLGMFNAVRFEEKDMWQLVLTLNADLASPLDGDSLRELFDFFWPKLKGDVENFRDLAREPKPAPASQSDLILEILDTVRDIQKRSRTSEGFQQHSIPYDKRLTELFSDVKLRVEDREPTTRELEIVEMVRSGLDTAETARLLGISERTIEGHLYRVYSKLGIADLEALLALTPAELRQRIDVLRSNNPE